MCKVGWKGDKCQIHDTLFSIDTEEEDTEESTGEDTEEDTEEGEEEDDEEEEDEAELTLSETETLSLTQNKLTLKKCPRCVHGACKKRKCICDDGWKGRNCDKKEKTSHLPIILLSIFILAVLGIIVYYCTRSFFTKSDPEEFPLIKNTS